MNDKQELVRKGCQILNHSIAEQPALFQLSAVGDVGFYLLTKEKLEESRGDVLDAQKHPRCLSMVNLTLAPDSVFWDRGLKIRMTIEGCKGTGCQYTIDSNAIAVLEMGIRTAGSKIKNLQGYFTNLHGYDWGHFTKQTNQRLIEIAESGKDKTKGEISGIIEGTNHLVNNPNQVEQVWKDPQFSHYGSW